MANEISNLPNSFLQFSTSARPSTCLEYSGVKLPIMRANDILFQLRINATSTGYLDTLNIYLVKDSYAVGETITATDIIATLTDNYAVISGSDYVYYVHDAACSSAKLEDATYPPEDGACVFLVIAIASSKAVVATCDQIFFYNPDTCWTKIVRYRCNDNSFGFFYEEADADLSPAKFYNSVRLNITLQNPVPLTERTGFRKSDGAFLTLASTKEKQYDIDTDYFDDHTHTCLDAAIDHDVLYLSSDQVAGCDYSDYEFHHPEGDVYTIDWQDKPGQHLGVAKAAFKLKSTPYYSENNNC